MAVTAPDALGAAPRDEVRRHPVEAARPDEPDVLERIATHVDGQVGRHPVDETALPRGPQASRRRQQSGDGHRADAGQLRGHDPVRALALGIQLIEGQAGPRAVGPDGGPWVEQSGSHAAGGR